MPEDRFEAAPFIAGSALGYRVFRIAQDDDLLRGPYQGEPWQSPVETMACKRHKHTEPTPFCGCGLYAYHDIRRAKRAGHDFATSWTQQQRRRSFALAAVVGAGRVEVSTDGWKAELAAIVGIAPIRAVDLEATKSCASRYQVPLFHDSAALALQGAFYSGAAPQSAIDAAGSAGAVSPDRRLPWSLRAALAGCCALGAETLPRIRAINDRLSQCEWPTEAQSREDEHEIAMALMQALVRQIAPAALREVGAEALARTFESVPPRPAEGDEEWLFEAVNAIQFGSLGLDVDLGRTCLLAREHYGAFHAARSAFAALSALAGSRLPLGYPYDGSDLIGVMEAEDTARAVGRYFVTAAASGKQTDLAFDVLDALVQVRMPSVDPRPYESDPSAAG